MHDLVGLIASVLELQDTGDKHLTTEVLLGGFKAGLIKLE